MREYKYRRTTDGRLVPCELGSEDSDDYASSHSARRVWESEGSDVGAWDPREEEAMFPHVWSEAYGDARWSP